MGPREKVGQLTMAESIFCDYVTRKERGEPVDFVALCRAHPDLAPELELLRHENEQLKQTLRDLRLLDADPGKPAPSPLPYALRGEIARGGMGTIVEGVDLDLGRSVAMKAVRRDGAPGDLLQRLRHERRRLRLLTEAEILGQLQHPSIVPVHEVGVDARGDLCFTMLLVEGQHFEQVIAAVREHRDAWTLARAVRVLQQVCEAVAYAHSKQVIHRDLKPQNIMVGSQGQVYVMDWGLAKAHAVLRQADVRLAPIDLSNPAALTVDGDVIGTPAYMSPEQARGHVDAIDERSDIYSLGAVLYHLLAGAAPYARAATASALAILDGVRAGPPPALHALAPRAPSELIAIAEKAMAREPRERYASMLDLAGDLRAFLEVRPVHAYATGAWPELETWVRRNRALAAAIAGTVLIIVAALAVIAVLESGFARTMRVQNQALGESNASAQASAAEAERKETELTRLADIKELELLEARAAALWPAHPERVAALEQWLADGAGFLSRVGVHRATLGALRTLALPRTEADLAREAERMLRSQLLLRTRTERDRRYAEARRLGSSEDDWRRVSALAAEVAALERDLPAPLGWTFASAEDQWQHDVLARFVDQVDAFAAQRVPEVERRLAFARTVVERTVSGADASARWSVAAASIADRAQCPRYAGLLVRPQLGLVPIGRDPQSGLWEFAHLQTGTAPGRDPDSGRLQLTEATGVVLALLPGGSCSIGESSGKGEPPPELATLRPFFISKYEMTQGQWLRATGENPSQMRPGKNDLSDEEVTLLHPVGFLSWSDADRVLRDLGLILPTEIQREYACRAGTTTRWWTGEMEESLEGAANLFDATTRVHGGFADWLYMPWTDGHAMLAPVGSFRANAFGLHDVHGNAAEWCRNAALHDDGTGYMDTRSAFRHEHELAARFSNTGVRPARTLAR